MFTILEHLKNRYLSQRAQGLTEYALILALVVAIGVAVFGSGTSSGLGLAIQNVFTKVTNSLNGTTGK